MYAYVLFMYNWISNSSVLNKDTITIIILRYVIGPRQQSDVIIQSLMYFTLRQGSTLCLLMSMTKSKAAYRVQEICCCLHMWFVLVYIIMLCLQGFGYTMPITNVNNLINVCTSKREQTILTLILIYEDVSDILSYIFVTQGSNIVEKYMKYSN